MPILGIIASSRPGVTNSYESIQTFTVGAGGQASISFTTIPATFKHLQVRAIARDGGSSNDTSSPKFTFNSDTSSTYTRHFLFGAGGGPVSAGFNSLTGFTFAGSIAQNGTTANVFGATIMDILDYQNTNKFKTLRTLAGADFNGDGSLVFSSALYPSTAAISSISITSSTATNFAQFSQFALYGIKG